MPRLLEHLAEPFDPIEPASVAAALAEHWGIDSPRLTRLETERDDTFRVDDADGTAAIEPVAIKIAHPSDTGEVIDLQCAVLEHVAVTDPGIPLQRLVRTRSGERVAHIDGRIARVHTWLEGDLLNDLPWTAAGIGACGRMLGRLTSALASLEHPASRRRSAWDIPLLPELRPDTDDPELLDVIDRFAATVAPRLASLPHQIVHNDYHPGNVLMAGDAVAGVLDVGDAARTPRVADLAIALTYLMPDAPRPWPMVEAFRAGYEAVVPLLQEEAEVLPMLIAARTVARSVIHQVMNPEGAARFAPFYESNRRKLARILED